MLLRFHRRAVAIDSPTFMYVLGNGSRNTTAGSSLPCHTPCAPGNIKPQTSQYGMRIHLRPRNNRHDARHHPCLLYSLWRSQSGYWLQRAQGGPRTLGWIVPDGAAEDTMKRRTWNVTHSVGSSFQFRTSNGHEARCSGSLLGSPSRLGIAISWLDTHGSKDQTSHCHNQEIKIIIPTWQPARDSIIIMLYALQYRRTTPLLPRRFYGDAMLHVPCNCLMIVPCPGWHPSIPHVHIFRNRDHIQSHGWRDGVSKLPL